MSEVMTIGELARMRSLGVRKVTLTTEAVEQLFTSVKGLFVPDRPAPTLEPNQVGSVMGIEVFQEETQS